MCPYEKKTIFTLPITVIALLLVVLIGAYFSGRRKAAQAEAYLVQAKALELHVPYAVALARLRAIHLNPAQEGDCKTECELDVRFVNSWQHMLRLAPATGLEGRLLFREGKLVEKITALGYGTCCLAYVEEYQSEASSAYLPRDADGRPAKAVIHLAASDRSDFRQRAYDFNLSCISKITGCKRSEDLLPQVWSLPQAK